jgi:hypothetical protein
LGLGQAFLHIKMVAQFIAHVQGVRLNHTIFAREARPAIV